MSNLELAKDVLSQLASQGVEHYCVCAGARNAPLVSLLSAKHNLKVEEFFEERQAAFYAIGVMRKTQRPVAVVTTSGTAVAELLPATVEADYQGLPLVLLTADRPKSFRGSAAPQSIMQPGIFSHYVGSEFDIENTGELVFSKKLQRPVHINICFDEPLLDGVDMNEIINREITFKVSPPNREKASRQLSSEINEKLAAMKRPLVIVSGLNTDEAKEALPHLNQLASATQAEFYMECLSNLRGVFAHNLCETKTALLKEAFLNGNYDGVIRVGSVPTVRLWRDLDSELAHIPVVSFSRLEFSGLAREELSSTSLDCLGEAVHKIESNGNERSRREAAGEELSLLSKFECSEANHVRVLSRKVPATADVFIGNSLPIREWDEFSDTSFDGQRTYFANRGVNGIDGLIASGLGLAGQSDLWIVVGDLSALYDMSALWALKYIRETNVRIVVINNSGGKIFNKIFANSKFENTHDLGFQKWAEMFNVDYIRISNPKEWPHELASKAIVELVPDEEQTKKLSIALENLN